METIKGIDKKEADETPGRGLIEMVFSWSIDKVLNKNLHKAKVGKIPMTFLSTSHYMKSFIFPLLEETRADLESKLTSINFQTPSCKIYSVRKSTKEFNPPKDLFYNISVSPMRMKEPTNNEGFYEPEVGDLVALTDERPKCIDDLKWPNLPYLVAVVLASKDNELTILSQRRIFFGKDEMGNHMEGARTFAVHLTNLTTNMRIWQALNSELEGENMRIISKVLRFDSTVNNGCSQCSSEKIKGIPVPKLKEVIHTYNLDDSQESAVLNCIANEECHHRNTVNLIWGPPGTGKTKTVASLLFTLLRMKCRAVTCAPTNIAVVGVATRVMSLVRASMEYDTYGLGDVVIFGNGERMKIDDYDELYDVFLDHRVEALARCFAPQSGWRGSVMWMIHMLEDPEEQYRLYLEKEKLVNVAADDDIEDEEEEEEEEQAVENARNKNLFRENEESSKEDLKDAKKNKIWKDLIVKTVKENKRKNIKKRKETEKRNEKENVQSEKRSEENHEVKLWTFDEFITKGFNFLGRHLMFCIKDMYTHLPTSLLTLKVAKQMIQFLDMFQAFLTLMNKIVGLGRGLREAFTDNDYGSNGKEDLSRFQMVRTEILVILQLLNLKITLPEMRKYYEIRNFCLKSSLLIFCTASSSIKLHFPEMTPVGLVVIDEAAQLKECESVIPLQLCGLRHAILIGDERQLPAMVQSELCKEAEFGRSLFERLVLLGHERHLLNVQYRMHPSISQFPNREIYDNQILDGPNVIQRAYTKHFLEGNMFGSYSFINVPGGEENPDNHSKKNLVEVAVVAEIVASLFKESVARKQRVSVGCITPYKAQLFAIQEKLGNTYNVEGDSYFSVSVRTVDGFQGGEEDVIVISTVRCNGKGKIGFFSNHQRENVALTRARYCMWIVGNGITLMRSGSIWKKLVADAKSRGCFHNSHDDKNLAQATADALIELGQLGILFNTDSLHFKKAKWKVSFDDNFLKTIAIIENFVILKEVYNLLVKISSGWRQPKDGSSCYILIEGTCSQLLEQYKVDETLYLIWTVDIVREHTECIQVLKVWDILPETKIVELASNLNELYGNYTVDTLERCKTKLVEGNLVLPLRWTNSGTDSSWSLVSHLSALSLRNEPRPPAGVKTFSYVEKVNGTNATQSNKSKATHKASSKSGPTPLHSKPNNRKSHNNNVNLHGGREVRKMKQIYQKTGSFAVQPVSFSMVSEAAEIISIDSRGSDETSITSSSSYGAFERHITRFGSKSLGLSAEVHETSDRPETSQCGSFEERTKTGMERDSQGKLDSIVASRLPKSMIWVPKIRK